MFCDFWRLPLEVGDMIYKIVNNKIVRYEITAVMYVTGQTSFRAVCNEEFDGVGIQSVIEFDLSAVDKDIFKTVEDAESYLNAKSGDNNEVK
jgi:hypothetical protein